MGRKIFKEHYKRSRMVDEPITKTLDAKVDSVTGAPLKEFCLVHGCISRDERITSRDISQPQYFDTLEEARQKLREHEEFYSTMGYKIWFARFLRRDGDKYVKIEP